MSETLATSAPDLPDLVYLRSADPLVVAKRGAKQVGSRRDAGCLLVHPGHHAIEFRLDVPPDLGEPSSIAPLLLDREVLHAGNRIPILARLFVFCPACSQWVALPQLGVSGLCLACRPPARATCRECGKQVRSDQVLGGRVVKGHVQGGTCLLCIPLGKLLKLGGKETAAEAG